MEPIGSIVYGNMYNPKHPTADEQGFRKDWIEALKKTDVPAVRLPGGNFVSGWDWKDSIGPKENRKEHLDIAWHQYYPNDVGHDEYLQWAEKVGMEPMYTINLGTGNINDAIYNVEYTNHPGGTYWSDLRKKIRSRKAVRCQGLVSRKRDGRPLAARCMGQKSRGLRTQGSRNLQGDQMDR
jgi:alpha-N-arabinofuranosidase